MILADKYEVLDRVGGAAIIVQRARDVASGQTVFVHRLIPGSQPATDALKYALRYAIQQPASRALLDVLDDASGTYIVTEDKPEYISLMDWLPWALSGNAPEVPVKPVAAPAKPEPARKEPGDFTQKFNALKQPSPPSDATFPPVQRPASNPPKLPLPKAEPGEFTRFFNPDAAAPKPDPTPVAQPKPEAGEFTRMFSNPLAQPTPSADLPAHQPLSSPNPPSHQPGEFTRIFGSGGPGSAGPARPPSTAAAEDLLGERLASPPSVSSGDPGEFTRIIRGSAGTPPAATPEPPPPPATPLPAASIPKPPIPAPTIPTPPVLPKPPTLKAPTVPPLAAPTLPKKGISPVLILIVAVVIAAVVAVLVFTMRR